MSFPDSLIHHLAGTKVVAGFSVERVDQAVPIAKALLEGGISAIELTLRTEAGIEALKAVASGVPGMLIGAGTVLTAEQVRQVKEAGAHFGVSPGINPAVVQAAQKAGLPFAPGICTPSELELAVSSGCRLVKFFPAEPMGGVSFLRSMAAPYKHLGILYFPLGGIHAGNMNDYLKEPDIPAVGGTWIVQKELVDSKNWSGIAARAAEVVRQLKEKV